MRRAVSRIVGTKRSGLKRFFGPETETAAMACVPEASKIGAATQVLSHRHTGHPGVKFHRSEIAHEWKDRSIYAGYD